MAAALLHRGLQGAARRAVMPRGMMIRPISAAVATPLGTPVQVVGGGGQLLRGHIRYMSTESGADPDAEVFDNPNVSAPGLLGGDFAPCAEIRRNLTMERTALVMAPARACALVGSRPLLGRPRKVPPGRQARRDNSNQVNVELLDISRAGHCWIAGSPGGARA
jgi:hypothetical protein